MYMYITFWEANIAVENGPFIVDLPMKIVMFHSYVSIPKGKRTSNVHASHQAKVHETCTNAPAAIG